jgi:uncharacterized membrane protein YbhN (UPF0104 family)
MRSLKSVLRQRLFLLACAVTVALAVVATSPHLLGDRVRDALDGVAAADPMWLWAGGFAFILMHSCSGLAWGVALRVCGTVTSPIDCVARYGIGSGLNAVAPLHLGSAARIALFGRISGEGGCWRVGGASAAVAAVRTIWLALLLGTGAVSGELPAWPLAVLVVGVGTAAAVAFGARRVQMKARVAHLLDAFRELGRSRRALASVAVLTAVGLTAKVAGAASVAAALGVERPLLAALLIVPTVELAAMMPLTPGNAGVASAAAAFALRAHGTDTGTALSAGIAVGAVETFAAVAIGLGGALALTGPRVHLHLRLGAAAAGCGAVGLACAVTVLPGV